MGGPEPVRRPGPSDRVASSRAVRLVWFGVGWVNVGVGGIGVVLPGLPTTIFFIFAAYSFSRSSPRFEAWILAIPTIGPMVSDYREGLGMPRRAKIFAVSSIVLFSSTSAILLRSRPWASLLIAALAICGILYILLRIPLREKVLSELVLAGMGLGDPLVDSQVLVVQLPVLAELPVDSADDSISPRASWVVRRVLRNESKERPAPEEPGPLAID